MRRIRRAIERDGISAVMDQHGGRPRRKRIALQTVREFCRLKREVYPDFSIRHVYARFTNSTVNGMELSYTFTLQVLQEAGVPEKEPGRAKHRRGRERRPMLGMLVHLDASNASGSRGWQCTSW